MHDTNVFHHTVPRLRKPAPEPHHPLIEPSLFYDPPYERPLEDEFAWHLIKYLRPIAGLRYQVKVETPCTNAWVDFIVEHGARRIGFEIGSLEADTAAMSSSDRRRSGSSISADEGGGSPRNISKGDEEQERYRDALVIGSGALDVLYRFRAADLLYRPHDALHLAAVWDQALFSERGRINLHTLASPEARLCRPRPHETIARITYATLEETFETSPDDEATWPQDVPPMLIVKRLSRANPGVWLTAYDEALRHFGVSDDRLEHRWAKSA